MSSLTEPPMTYGMFYEKMTKITDTEDQIYKIDIDCRL